MTDPYQIICPKCKQTISLEKGTENLPEMCPFCRHPLENDYNLQYHPSTHSKTYRIVATAILVFFAIILLLGLAVLLFHR